MSQVKRIDLSIVVIAIIILFAVVLMNAAPAEQFQLPWQSSSTANTESEIVPPAEAVEIIYNDALTLQYARQNGKWEETAVTESVEYTDALALQYARQNGNWEETAATESVEWSDAMALQYAYQYGGRGTTETAQSVEWSDALALDYARQNGSWKAE